MPRSTMLPFLHFDICGQVEVGPWEPTSDAGSILGARHRSLNDMYVSLLGSQAVLE